MECIGIIWNAAFPYREEALAIISRYATLKSHFDLDLKDDYEFFVRRIYQEDSIAEWKVNAKIEHMSSTTCHSVCIVYFDVDTSIVRYHEQKKHNVYARLQELKDVVRSSLKEKVNNYFFDIIFHCSDDEAEYVTNKKIIDSFVENH